MRKELKQLLVVDALMRITGLASFTIFIGAAYTETLRASSVGLIGLATVAPSLVVIFIANRAISRFSPKSVLLVATIGRIISLVIFAVIGSSPNLILIAAAFQSFFHQISLSTKMTLDSVMLGQANRREYLARKAMLSSAAVVCAPALGGLLVGTLGYNNSLAVLALFAIAIGASLAKVHAPALPKTISKVTSNGLVASLKGLKASQHVATLIGLYCLVASLLETQAPLVFPFVHEVYREGSGFGGLLLGVCGLGGLAGAHAAERWPRAISPAILPMLVILDGFIFFVFTQIESIPLAFSLFTLLGVMGSITIILVEGVVQTEVRESNRPFVFSLMQFAAGAGGATIGMYSSFVAEMYTTKVVLCGAAIVEMAIGAICAIFLRGMLKMATSVDGK